MDESKATALAIPVANSGDVLTEVLRSNARRLLGQAIEAEVADWLESHQHIVDE